ncbi:DUF6906 family protein [Lacrimispora sp. JR3]|uniref:DUF6906 family protein n=1 Tax=Lacrimispora sinapis TaxID=3111456 RepID=UPI00374A914E
MGRPGKPTRGQREIIRQNGYDPEVYLVISNEARKMRLLNVVTGEKLKIKKNPAGMNCQGSGN